MSVQVLNGFPVEFYATFAAFPVVGTKETIYVDSATENVYVWDGSIYVLIHASAATAPGYVPYTGATADVALGAYGISATIAYIGDPTTDGSWRFVSDGAGGLDVQKRESGSWVSKGTFIA